MTLPVSLNVIKQPHVNLHPYNINHLIKKTSFIALGLFTTIFSINENCPCLFVVSNVFLCATMLLYKPPIPKDNLPTSLEHNSILKVHNNPETNQSTKKLEKITLPDNLKISQDANPIFPKDSIFIHLEPKQPPYRK
jgi:hypothetical protein